MSYIILLLVTIMLMYVIYRITEITTELNETKKELSQKLEDVSARKFFATKEAYPTLYKFDGEDSYYTDQIEEYQKLTLAYYKENNGHFLIDYFVNKIKSYYKDESNELKKQNLIKNYIKYSDIIHLKIAEKSKGLRISNAEKSFLQFKLQHNFLWEGRVVGFPKKPFEEFGFNKSIEHEPGTDFEKYIDEEIYRLIKKFTKIDN